MFPHETQMSDQYEQGLSVLKPSAQAVFGGKLGDRLGPVDVQAAIKSAIITQSARVRNIIVAAFFIAEPWGEQRQFGTDVRTSARALLCSRSRRLDSN